MASTLSFVTYNGRGLRQSKKRRRLFAFLHRNNYDVCLLQETHSCIQDEIYWKNEWGGTIIFCHGSKDSRGVCVLIKPSLAVSIHKECIHAYGRFIILDIEINNCIFTLVGVYGPNIDTPAFYTELCDKMGSFLCETIVMAGDFNFVFSLELDKTGGQAKTNFKARDKWLSLMSVYSLIDIWRGMNPFGKHYTWSSNITPDIHCRLDYFLISHHLRPSVHSVHFSPGLQSDHCFCILVIAPVQMARGPGIWKFNDSLLDDTIYVSNMNNCIIDALKEVGPHNPAVSWDFVKYKIRKFSMAYSKEKAKLRRRREYELLKIILSLEQQLFFNPSASVSSQLKNANFELLDYYDFKLRGTIIRSKARWVEDGEKNSKYFLNLEKRNKSFSNYTVLILALMKRFSILSRIFTQFRTVTFLFVKGILH
ncbi:hypothetical protein HOLleu_21234 [Holothuria leucospilota]|uniref:exodeoxyribonuclease III n=1 Tax=Holothuria leucospilota TaxID=206669 RepID=A0A9Q1H6N7_HOLLE|nr:hypothetical protein HOLleu_21234 [Holothuria leucospilota]